jgi:3-hydroxybutyryl-CoA dehydratase
MLAEPLTLEQIEALPIYDWEVARVGDAAPPFTYAVTAESIRDYCLAVRNENALYLDPDAAARGPFGGIVAPPTYFFKCAPLRRNEVMHARGYASPEERADRATPYAKSELHFLRPVRPGDEITSSGELEDKYERRGSQFITWRARAHDQRGEPVVDYSYTIIWRQAPRDPSAPTAPAAPSTPPIEAAPADRLPIVTKVESQEAIDQYAELTRVRPRRGHSLHSDPEFARRTIFGGTVNMGVATAAYCSEALERAFGPTALLRPGGRLEYKGIKPIRAGYEISIAGRVVARRPNTLDCELTVHNQDSLLVGVATATVVVE